MAGYRKVQTPAFTMRDTSDGKAIGATQASNDQVDQGSKSISAVDQEHVSYDHGWQDLGILNNASNLSFRAGR